MSLLLPWASLGPSHWHEQHSCHHGCWWSPPTTVGIDGPLPQRPPSAAVGTCGASPAAVGISAATLRVGGPLTGHFLQSMPHSPHTPGNTEESEYVSPFFLNLRTTEAPLRIARGHGHRRYMSILEYVGTPQARITDMMH